MPPTKQQLKKLADSQERRIDDFNTFALSYTDWQTPPQPYFIMEGEQVVWNISCQATYAEVLTAFRKKK